ncbi:MAG: I78 family peptidase inhibitor [Pseudomonadota bacterium]
MRIVLFFALATASAMLASCGPPPDAVGLEPVQGGSSVNTAVSPVADGSCNAEIYSYLVGEPISVVSTLNTGLSVRVLAADAFVTRDFNPNRLTFTTTPKDTVGRVFCG